MTSTAKTLQTAQERLAALLPGFAERAAAHDAEDCFVAENFAALKAARLMSAAVPADLGGDGLAIADLARLLHQLAGACPSTALAFAMHTHVVALLAWRRQHQKAPVDAVLGRIAREQLTLISSGGSDWLDSAGTARRGEGGFVIDAVKAFASGSPAGDLLNTSAIYQDPQAGPTVLHFMVPLTAKEVTVEQSWRAMGMRGTGSGAIRLDGFFVADAAVGAKRPRGKWHPLFHMVSMVAIPLVYSVYYAVAESMRDVAVGAARLKPASAALIDQVGELETELAAARMALADMLQAAEGPPCPETTNRVFLGRANVVRALMAVAERALELGGGQAYQRPHRLEQLFRDLQAARFHPLPARQQRELAGKLALGLDID